MVIQKLKKIILVLFLCISFQVFPVSASAEVENTTTQSENEVVSEKKMSFFEDLHYRIIYKDTKDFFDYVILGTAIVSLLIVMVLQNTHYVIVKIPLEESIFQDEKSTYTVEEVSKEIETETKNKAEDKKKEENPEILSSDLLEEEVDMKPIKKDRNNRKKRA